jgi:ribonuclease P protein component
VFDKYNFSKKARLLKKIQFQAVLEKGQPLFGKYYVFHYEANELISSRLGIIVAKKKCRLAVLRNRIKRQAREAFRHYQNKLPGYDVVVIARQSAREASKCELRQCLDNLFSKLTCGLTG